MRDTRRRSRDVNRARRYVTIRALPILTALALLVGCATTKASPQLTAAVTLDELGAVFIQTAQTMKDLHLAGALDPQTEAEWVGFVQTFGPAWLAAKQLVEAGQPGGDALATVFALKNALFEFALRAVTIKAAREEGTPS